MSNFVYENDMELSTPIDEDELQMVSAAILACGLCLDKSLSIHH